MMITKLDTSTRSEWPKFMGQSSKGSVPMKINEGKFPNMKMNDTKLIFSGYSLMKGNICDYSLSRSLVCSNVGTHYWNYIKNMYYIGPENEHFKFVFTLCLWIYFSCVPESTSIILFRERFFHLLNKNQ